MELGGLLFRDRWHDLRGEPLREVCAPTEVRDQAYRHRYRERVGVVSVWYFGPVLLPIGQALQTPIYILIPILTGQF